jgi:hypothetical protein
LIRGVTTVGRIEFMLDIDPNAEPIAGAVRDGSGDAIEFAGWLGFASALETMLSASRRAAARSHPDPGRTDPPV